MDGNGGQMFPADSNSSVPVRHRANGQNARSEKARWNNRGAKKNGAAPRAVLAANKKSDRN
jgi:hypothetical protein